MDISEVQRVVGQIKARLFKNSNSYSVGMLKSNFRGSGLQFREHRIYTHGDDVRFIDWKMLAKTQKPYIRTFEEERNVEICVIIDASPSMYLGFYDVTKLQASIEICCLLYLLAKESGDSVHALIAGEELLDIPKSSGEKGIAMLISMLEKSGYLKSRMEIKYPENLDGFNVDYDKRLLKIMNHVGRRRELVILSDFNDFLKEQQMKRLISKRNVYPFQMIAPIDKNNKIPYGIFASGGRKSGGSFVCANSESKNVKDLLAGKIKKLDLEERYLENFVKEMTS